MSRVRFYLDEDLQSHALVAGLRARAVDVLTTLEAGRNVTEAAKQLGVSRITLYRLMAKHGIGADLRR